MIIITMATTKNVKMTKVTKVTISDRNDNDNDKNCDKVLDRCDPNSNNIVIPGSNANSDLSTPISVVKNRVKAILYDAQNRVTPGRKMEWLPENNWCTSPNNC